MEEISQESLVINPKRRNVSSININFPSDFKNQLINAARITTDRHLTQTSLFLLEMANSLKKSENDKFKADSSPYLPNYTTEEETRFTMAKIQFDNFHYLKCIQCLDEEICTSAKSDFLRLYAELKFIIYNGTRDLHDEITICASHTIQSHPSFENLKRKLERKADRGQLDAFGLYLYGLVLNANKEKDEARKVLIESIKRYDIFFI